MTRNRAADKKKAAHHAVYAWTCTCGKTVAGNGGRASHQRWCHQWQADSAVRHRALAEHHGTASFHGERHLSLALQCEARAAALVAGREVKS